MKNVLDAVRLMELNVYRLLFGHASYNFKIIITVNHKVLIIIPK